MVIEIGSGNKAKIEQASKAAQDVLELTSRKGQPFETYFDEDSIKQAVETRLNIPLSQPYKYALAISQLKIMKHMAELTAREPDHAREVIPLVTDSIAVSQNRHGQLVAINRDDLVSDPAFKQEYLEMIQAANAIGYSAFASFAFPGDAAIYTVPTFLDIEPGREIKLEDLPTNGATIPGLAKGYRAGYLHLEENAADKDFAAEKMEATLTTNWEAPNANRHEPARQYMGGTTYGLMQLINKMSAMTPAERALYDGELADGNVIPFVRIDGRMYADVVSSLPLPAQKA